MIAETNALTPAIRQRDREGAVRFSSSPFQKERKGRRPWQIKIGRGQLGQNRVIVVQMMANGLDLAMIPVAR
ncbi:hypothetical protein [Rhizobium viscosum]|uniref:LysR family transcriptional regulator n=1 Tax=Rhizobium viscosum TaxID=1673 RepID=A0ABR9IZ36_RHIVS|nr:hypothetical protein [Rhizobium viscosum]MBE1508487.1 hypothetical protein [Rhizobium viscosum]